MADFSNYRIGRSETCEIHIADPTISRIHAEITVSKNTYFLVDCNSSSGTFVQQNGKWVPLRQSYVNAPDLIRFGNYQTSCSALLSMISSTPDIPKDTPEEEEPDSRPVGQVKRNPLTGEIIKR